MKQSIYHRLSSVLWGAIVLSIVLLAVYVSVGRILSSLTDSFHREILQELNNRVPFVIEANRVSAEWHSFNPVLVLNGLQLTIPGEPGRPLELSEGRIALDVAGSLLSGSPQMTQLHLSGLNLAAELDGDGKLRIRGFEPGDTPLGEWLEEYLLNVERVALGNTHLELRLPEGEQRTFDLDLVLSREGSRRRLEVNLLSSRGTKVFVLGEGVGNPFAPGSFSGQVFLDIDAIELGAANDVLPDSLRRVRVDGSLGLELWSSWDLGNSSTSLRLKMDDVLLSARDASWQVPLDRVAFEASLEDRNGGWGLWVAGLEIARGEALLQVPRLQLDIRGETVELRALALPLAPLGSLLADIESLPSAAVDLLRTLQPRGSLRALRASIADISEPLADWQLQASFDQLAVDAWYGAPGITGGRGYVELSPGSGFVVLDSRQFSLAFPTIYEAPLRYDDFHGTIHIDWNDEAVVLSSGLVEASGEEGKVPVLFGLTIPLVENEAGLEMDLLVGLRDTHSAHRGKYIPNVLDADLLDWLRQSIGDGLIEQGGFLWRGSLEPEAESLRTVQLFFDVSDTGLRYHPDWPPLADVDGTVLIDDSQISVWAATASLLDSAVVDLSVEVWVDAAEELWLALDGNLAGPAANGLTAVNQSPLRQLVGEVFTDWHLTGNLETDIELLLNLSDSTLSPEVEVSARFDAVDLDVNPGQLPLRNINGILNYDTAAGFSSRELAGQLWDQPLQATISQRPGTDGTDKSAVVVELSSLVDVRDVQQWLAPDLPGFAQGQTGVRVNLVVGAGEPPILNIDSTLDGVSVDLPEPWNKPAAEARPLHLDLSPDGEDLRVGLTLAGGLAAQLELVEGQLRSAVLAFDSEPTAPEPGIIRITGRTAYADTSQWQRFVTDYLSAVSSPPAVGDQVSAPAIVIDDLLVDRLVAGGQDLGAVLLNLAEDGGLWRVAAETPWLRGELLYDVGGVSELDIQHLDLAGLPGATPTPEAETHIVELPDMKVNIAELRRADTLLGNLAFDLHSEGADLYAQNISGQIAAMELPAQAPGQLLWRQGPNQRTTIQARLVFRDLGQTLAELGYQKIIETDEGVFDLALEWPGGPPEFSLLHSKGSLQVDIGKGNFPDAPGGASGALRVVSILNLAEIVRRLSLSHMFESGIPFNKVDGEVFLHSGTIEVARMEVQGGASSFQFSGVSAVESRSLSGELVVTLPVANNLPWVAALTAGLPVAAGVFLLSKVFETPLNRLTSAVYSATGTWDDPTVKFDRVFDDTAAPSAAVDDAAGVVVPADPPASP